MTEDVTFAPGELDDEFVQADEIPQGAAEETYDEPDPGFIKGNARTVRGRKYEQSTRTILNTLFKEAVAHESTVPDAAAIIMYGPGFSERLGNLADHDARVRRGLDMLMEGAENPYLAFAMVGIPFVAQLYRNHQDTLAPRAILKSVKTHRAEAKEKPGGRQFKIPFTKRTFTVHFRLSAPPIENFTSDPTALANHVFSDPSIIASLEKAGITNVAFNGNATPKSPAAKRRSR
jgi:hypothetical protein